jgi:hypothetical protein
MATRLSRTQTSGNRKTWTFSAWLKRTGSISGTNTQNILYAGVYSIIRFENERLEYLDYDGSSTALKNTSALLRDTNAWYHIVVSVDFTQATADNRVKFYINGEQQTSFSTNNVKAQNYDTKYFIDGTAYDASTFGETDATTGIWKPKTEPVVTYGTNGFFLKFENSASFGTDSSGNANNFTVNGTMTQTIDTPSNVFATLNPLINVPNQTYANGNTKCTDNDNAHKSNYATLGFSSGKYYWEAKNLVGGSKYTIGLSVCRKSIRSGAIFSWR